MSHKNSPRIFTVSEITQDIKLILESAFTQVWVEGEISGLSRIATGTIFFNLKDSASVLKCVIFFSTASTVRFKLKDGMRVVCGGRISVYDKDGRYQLYVQSVEPKGIGSLQLALEELKAKLEKEGLFAPAHKRQIPYLPSCIGLVTSLQGAAIKDIFKVLERRFKDIHIIVNPVKVQGEGAKEEIAQAIADMNTFNQSLPLNERIEVMIVGRGGGSIEDLWAFNEEVVARAIYRSKIPVISAVGHERDWTIADLVADVRAATPSVAAELVIPRQEDLRGKLDTLGSAIEELLAESIVDFQQELDELVRHLSVSVGHVFVLDAQQCAAAVKKLNLVNPIARLRIFQETLTHYTRQLGVRISHYLALRTTGLRGVIERLVGLSPLNILSRGYSITFQMPQETVLKEAQGVHIGDEVKTRLHKGEIISRVTQVNEEILPCQKLNSRKH